MAHLYFFQPHKVKNETVKEPPILRTIDTANIVQQSNDRQHLQETSCPEIGLHKVN
jgi:hypothetical protein